MTESLILIAVLGLDLLSVILLANIFPSISRGPAWWFVMCLLGTFLFPVFLLLAWQTYYDTRPR